MSNFIINGQKVNVVFKKNKFGVWQYDAYCNGKRTRKSTKQRDRKLAEDVFQNDSENIVKKSTRTGTSLLFENIWEAYINTPTATSPSQQRLEAYQQKVADFTAFIKNSHKIVFVNEITEQMTKQYIQHIRKNGRFIRKAQHVKNLSAATKNEYLKTLKMVFNLILDEAGLEINPFAKIQNLRVDDKVSREIYTLEELDMLIKSEIAQASYLYPLIMIAPFTGLREGDICTLKSSEVDFKRNSICRIQRKTKTPVDVPIMDTLREFLLEQDFNNEYLFPELADQYATNSNKIGKDFTQLLADHGIASNKKVAGRDKLVSVKDVHSFRHTFVYLAAVNGIPLPIVQGVVGHLAPEMTKMYMNHATNDDKQNHFKKLSITINGKKSSIVDRLKDMTASNWQNIRDEIITMLQ